ncbi:hypothetical protein [Halalkalibacter alkaliphilus]|uniref:Uncharacterized protein n=1 Tax=Halalkalibacter alkaliphilus TaxID=2917993 RepID=A0A9X2I9I0_9BACI|nr:hypothetical protein [Halalkalibacter alkaliphilus]MCL7748765.1 hypothetical protein [Halalkalibacter alkaliphilus]
MTFGTKKMGITLFLVNYEEWKKAPIYKLGHNTLHSGEVASYQFLLELNELRCSFLLLGNYLKNGLTKTKDPHGDEDLTKWF